MTDRDCDAWRRSVARRLAGEPAAADDEPARRAQHERHCPRCGAEAAFWRQLEQAGPAPASDERRAEVVFQVVQSFVETGRRRTTRWRPLVALGLGVPALAAAAVLVVLAVRPRHAPPAAEHAATARAPSHGRPRPPIRLSAPAGEGGSATAEAADPATPLAMAVPPLAPGQDVAALLATARAHRERGRLREAVEIYLGLEARRPQDPEVLAALGAITSPLYLINAGGPDYVDGRGRQWDADRHFTTGNPMTSKLPIAGVADRALYQTARIASDKQEGAADLHYAFVAGAGSYVVKLHFLEVDPAVSARGQRQFDVILQNTLVLDDFDIFADAGPRRVTVEAFTATSAQGKLTLQLKKVRGTPVVSAIEVLSIVEGPRLPPVRTVPPPATATETVYRINAGGPDYEDEQGHLWEADAYFNTGHPAAPSRRLDPVEVGRLAVHHRTHRFDDESDPELRYSFPVPRGRYLVRLHFAETHRRAARPGGRMFNVLLEGSQVLERLDVFAEAGFLAPLVKPFTVTVTDGALDIDFEQVTEHPMISGIEVIGLADTSGDR